LAPPGPWPGCCWRAFCSRTGKPEFPLSNAECDFGPGTYIKNPPGSSHAPFSENGCTLLVKLRWAPGTFFNPHRHHGGEEIYVVEDIFEDENGRYPAGTCLRSPHLSQHQPFSRAGCLIFVKTGHLPVAHQRV
jgi:anti-sigma factor ChrR (cupin superfamily)